MSAEIEEQGSALVARPDVITTTGIEFSEGLSSIAKAILLAQGNMGEIIKDSTNPHFRSKYADLPTCVNAVQPALQSAGIALVQAATSSPDGSVVFVETMFLHESGEWIRSRLGLRPVKPDPQGAGSAITYGRRYGLLAMCGVAPEEDDDGNAASRKPRRQNGAEPPPERENERGRVLGQVARGMAALGLSTPAEYREAILSATGVHTDEYAELSTEDLAKLVRHLVAEYHAMNETAASSERIAGERERAARYGDAEEVSLPL